MNTIKLQKALQAAGIDSRRRIRQAINDGEVRVNDAVITDPNHMVDIGRDMIRLNDKKLKLKPESRVYFILNKPLGVISSLKDPQGRPTIVDYIGKIKERVFPVGRLDYHSEGLMLLTNDGELMNYIISPRNQIPKKYQVKIKGFLNQQEINKLTTKGIFLEGSRVKPLKIELVRKTPQSNSWINVTIIEGKKHVLRKLFKYSGHPVEKLKRMTIGTFRLKKLPVGQFREVTREELEEFSKRYKYRF